MALPKYRSHKVVEACKLGMIDRKPDGSASLHPVEVTLPIVDVGAAYMIKHDPRPGGYYVRYPDGYESWSPAGAFEDGYSPVS